jgi:DNA-binding protein HU-beta
MNKAELALKISEKLNIAKKQAEDFIEAFDEIVTNTLVNDGEVTIAGFGTFSARVRRGRAGVNPQNPTEKIQIPSVKVPKFKAGKSLKDALKGKTAKPTAAPVPTPAPAPEAPAAPIAPTV